MTEVLRRLGVALAVAALIVLAALSLNRVYSGLLLVQLVAGAALASVLISVALRRVPGALVAPVSVLAMGGYALYAISVAARAGGVTGDLQTLALDAARNALPRLLSALIPVEPQPDTVLAPVILAWLAGFAGAELSARARRPAMALLPPTLLYASALVLVGPNASVNLWQPLLFAGIAATALVVGSASSGAGRLRSISGGQRAWLRLRTASGLGAGLAAILAAVVVVSPLVAGRVGSAPGDPRVYVEPPNLDVLDQNPLIRISGWAAFPEQELFHVDILRGASPTPSPTPSPTASASVDPFAPELEAPPPPPIDAGNYDTRLRLAVLPDWDGVTWHMDAEYRNAGRVLPPVPPPPGYDTERANPYPPLTVEERITVAELKGRLLPAVAAPTRVDGIRVAYDQSHGALLNATALTPGTTYTVTSVSENIDIAQLIAASVPSGDDVARYLGVGPAVPTELSQFAQKVAQGESSPYLRALAVQTFMQEHYTYDPAAPSGHAYPNLKFFLLAEPLLGGQRGTSEQFATGFATLCRLLGLPTRVVVGFRVPAGGGTVTAGDAIAWPEVLFAGIGWVPFDPMPLPDTVSRPVEPEFMPPPPPTTDPPNSVTPSAVSASVSPGANGGPPAAREPSGLAVATVLTGTGIGAAALLVLGLLAILLLRAVQTRRRLHAGDPARAVVGAWDEVVDGLVLAGRPPPPHLAAAEVADYAALVASDSPGRAPRRPRPAAPPLDGLARTVNAVAFGGRTVFEPDDSVAESARSRAVAFRRALYSRRSWWRRLLWWIDPRPLRRRRR